MTPPTAKVQAMLWAFGIGSLLEHLLVLALARGRREAAVGHAIGLPIVLWLALHFGYEAVDAD